MRLSINVSDPLVFSERAEYGNLALLAEEYSHELTSDMGFASARLTFGGAQYVNEYALYGLGRHVEVHGPDLALVWEGFVNSVEINNGTYSQSIGPLVDVRNRVVAEYTPVDPAADPPATGPESETTAASDTDSQGLYGIWDGIVAAGSVYEGGDLAEQIRDVYLGDRAYPQTSERVAVGDGAEPSVTLHLRGYKDWLCAYVYNTATTSTSTITAKLQAVLGADPNSIFSTNYAEMETNSALVAARERDNRPAIEVVNELTASGDGTNDERWIFLVLNDRVVYHYALPDETAYEHRIFDLAQRITTVGGDALRPETILPGRWLFVPDYLAGQIPEGTDRREDPRYIFIESVRYTAPETLEINGARLDELPQLLAQKGLGGLA